VTYKQLIYGGTPIPSLSETAIISKIQEYYKSSGRGYRKVAYFNYDLGNLNKEFPLCVLETYESIFLRFCNYIPEDGRKCDVLADNESIIFPRFSIVYCSNMPIVRGHRKIYLMFVAENANRFIILIDFHKKNAFPYCGGYSHILYSSVKRLLISNNNSFMEGKNG
jgi:hypothetical protein